MLRPIKDVELNAILIAGTVLALAVTFYPAPIQLTAAVIALTLIAVVSRGVRHDQREPAVTAHH